MTNSDIASILDEIADLLEFQGANGFRVRAYRNGARAISDLGQSVKAIVEDDPAKLQEIDGVGKSVAEKCVELVRDGQLEQLNELRKAVPESALAIMRIPGLGPKKAAALFKQLGVKTLQDVKQACEDQKVRELKGFGAKTEETILKGIPLAEEGEKRIYWQAADELAAAMREHLGQCDGISKLELAGSYRRGKETVGDLDVLVVADDVDEVMDLFGDFNGVETVLARGGTKMSVRLTTGFQIDLRVVPAESFGAALQYFTGSKEHNVVLRGKARQAGLKINEYGVFRVEGDEETYIAGETEEDVYATLKMPVFAPETRENRGEFDWAEEGELPDLIELEDLVADLHMHTTETDGKASLEEMVEAARKRGLKYIAITDHSKRVTMARGLDEDRLLKQWEEIDKLNEKLGRKFTVLKGIECDILEKGGMDLDDKVLSQADWVLASVHYGQQQASEQITKRIVEAIENPHVDCIAHPTGRLLNRREPYAVDMDAVFEAVKKHKKLLELNANPVRLDLNDVHCAAAKRHGIPIVISTDAHSIEDLGLMRYGVVQARRGGLTKKDVANTRTWKQMQKLMPKG